MIIFVILGVLFLGSLIIMITHSYRPNTARSWLIAIVTAMIAWVASFVMRLYLPSEVNLWAWFPGTSFEETLALLVDYNSWPYMVAVLSMCVAALLTDTTRTQSVVMPYSWSQTISIAGLNLLAILAANPLTMAIAWMLTDLIELYTLLRLSKAAELGAKIVALFSIRIFSTFMLITATSIAWQGQPFQGFDVMQPNASLFFLIAAGLRLGVFPLNLPFLDTPELRWGAGTLFRLIPAASALVLIANLPEGLMVFNQDLLTFVQVLILIAAFYSSLMWLTRKNQFEARPYWMVTLSAFAAQSALNGHPEASRVWGLALLLSGSLLLLFNPPIRRIRFLPLLGLLGFIGLPYTLAASGWDGLMPDKFGFPSVILILTHAFLVLGYIRFIVEGESTVTGLEKYARITFPLGLVTLIQTILVLGLVGWPGVLTVGNLVGSAGSLLVVVIGALMTRQFGFRMNIDAISRKFPFYRLFSMLLDFFRKVLSLNWLSSLIKRAYTSLAGLMTFFSEILEGDGGILWSLVFLLILSILFLGPGR